MNLRLKRTPGIYMVGFMGAGKTTVGSLLAAELGWNFADLDDDIEGAAGVKISEIFETRGEDAFRELESAALATRVRKIERGSPTVLAMGGGAFAQESNFRLVSGNGISIWLDCPLDLIQQRIAGEHHRPLAADPEQFAQLYDARQESYGKADYRVDGSGSVAEVVGRILKLPVF